ncbi:hypothetical protein BDZ91DRAFT_761767 [Kalaharituber pfeilii]|nr:hypothetical protein BDZ91DRAFT_761767 [Kalaharituber pfeilii]
MFGGVRKGPFKFSLRERGGARRGLASPIRGENISFGLFELKKDGEWTTGSGRMEWVGRMFEAVRQAVVASELRSWTMQPLVIVKRSRPGAILSGGGAFETPSLGGEKKKNGERQPGGTKFRNRADGERERPRFQTLMPAFKERRERKEGANKGGGGDWAAIAFDGAIRLRDYGRCGRLAAAMSDDVFFGPRARRRLCIMHENVPEPPTPDPPFS